MRIPFPEFTQLPSYPVIVPSSSLSHVGLVLGYNHPAYVRACGIVPIFFFFFLPRGIFSCSVDRLARTVWTNGGRPNRQTDRRIVVRMEWEAAVVLVVSVSVLVSVA
ncbi:hypothetical protein JOL62DRAFT_236323 [Phyllosticta paracitricarpa]|uniref:Uncharacterized protein n=1 Tax=Phyllosticta paracitricarpa TaxID=2016321 RepID=A0ABR1NI43_9PEZI